ncbi:hypothetical protein [Marinobacterium ramblicola]|uniref:hypothetical protein n=1 Tax=Marinobacterium ramblicola TaxID=2849041 RepID=UPI001C2D68B3|nr:hypothetical protein [Marinobacterium ramblicola]
MQLKAFAGGIGHARSLLIKREPVDHEREVRLIFVEPGDDHDNSLLLPIEINPDTLFEEVVLDPRLQADDAKARETEIRSFGYNGPITKSELYRSALYNIVLR